MRQLLVEADQVVDINVAVVLLEERIFPQLISAFELALAQSMVARQLERIPIDEVVVKAEVENESFQLRLKLQSSIRGIAKAWLIHMSRVDRLTIHCD